MSRVMVIAEAGVNHNGDISLARRLIEVAAEAGADAVKFQSFRAERLASRAAAKADYQQRTTDRAQSQLDMLRGLELSREAHEQLAAHARTAGVTFLSTPFDEPSLYLLTGCLGMQVIKVSSGEVTNAPFLVAIARAARQVILSTGMSDLGEVEAALGALAFGFVAPTDALPAGDAFERAFASAEGQRALRERLVLLHCTSEYPAPASEVNLRAMDTLAAAFGVPVGYSDHTLGLHVAVAAVARGARLLEKHFTLDRKLPGPDHAASLEPAELKELVRQVREVEESLGDGIKRPSVSEWKNRSVARRSLVALRTIAPGEVFSLDNLTCKRPGKGRPPADFWRVLGTPATRAYVVDEPIDE